MVQRYQNIYILASFLDTGDSSNKSAKGYTMVATDPGSTNKPIISSTGSDNIGESEQGMIWAKESESSKNETVGLI